MADLVSPTDPDVAAFNAGDEALYVRAAGETVRRYVGWHVAPNIAENVRVEVGDQGIAMLPSRFVTAVVDVRVEGQTLVAVEDFTWAREGWLQLHRVRNCQVTLTMTHGYSPDLPADVKAVVLELASAAQEKPSSTATSFKTPGFGISFSEGGGLALTDDQMRRLIPYKIGFVG